MPPSAFRPSIHVPTGDPPSCEELLTLITHGDRIAFETLYRREMPAVRRLALGLLRDSHQAEEVAQEVMLMVWQQAARFDVSLGSGRSWILRMTRSRAIDRVRMCESDRIRDHGYNALDGDRSVQDVAEFVSCRIEADRVRHALLQVSTQQRESLVLAFFSPLSYSEIAAHLQIPLSTFKTRMRDGLIKLRRILDDAENFESAA